MPPPPRPQTKLAKCCHYCRSVTTFLFSHIGLFALVLAYAFLGAFAFHYLESHNEQVVRNRTREHRLDLVESLWRLTDNQTVLVYEEWIEDVRGQLIHFEEEIIRAVKHDGFDGKEFGAESQWSIPGSMLYSIIVITTIGYGNIAPKTPIGRLVTMIYAIAGIPLMLLFLSKIGDVMAHSFKFIYWKICYTLCIKQKKRKRHRRRHRHRHHSDALVTDQPIHTTSFSSANRHHHHHHHHQQPQQLTTQHDANRVPIISNNYAFQSEITEQLQYATYPMRYRPDLPTLDINRAQSYRQYSQTSNRNQMYSDESDSYSSDSDSDDDEEGNVPIFMCMSLVVGYICGGAWLFYQWEESWSYLDSAYFCFVTLTTIGFGDMVPGAAVVTEGTEGRTTLIICAFYLLFGMALLAMSFNLVQEEVTKSIKNVGRKIGIISKNKR